MSILDLPRRSMLSPATQENVVLNDLKSPLYLLFALLRKHFNVFASPRTRITGGSLASSNNLPSRPECFAPTDRSCFPTSLGDTPRNLGDSRLARLEESGEVENDLLLRRCSLPPLLPALPCLPLPLPLVFPSRDRFEV